MIQLILHLFGDYITQSDWMALNKRTSTFAAFCHATVYSFPFYWLGSYRSLFVIWITHLFIDRFGLARYVVWAKNFSWFRMSRMQTLGEAVTEARENGLIGSTIGPGEAFPKPKRLGFEWTWNECSVTGYDPSRPAWLAVGLMIAADNTLHLAINYAALRWL